MKSKRLINYGKVTAFKQIALQALFVVILASCIFCFISSNAAYSVVIGGFIAIIPNVFFILFTFAYIGARQAKSIMLAFYLGETVKLLLTIVLFSLTFMFLKQDLNFVLGSFIVTLLFQWLSTPFFFKNITG